MSHVYSRLLIKIVIISGFLLVVKVKPVLADWTHPGILNTKNSLDTVRLQYERNDTERRAAYQRIINYTVSAVFPENFIAIVDVVGNGDGEDELQIKNNANLAYTCALRFVATSDTSWSNKAIKILNGWAYTFQGFNNTGGGPADQPSLEASWMAPTFAAAAEIIRHYKTNGVSAEWATADIDQFGLFLRKLAAEVDKMNQRGNNWWASSGYAKMAMGVFLEDQGIYDNGRTRVLSTMEGGDSYNGHDLIDADGYPYELHQRSDDVHFQYSLTAITYAAEIDKIQGYNNIYTQKGDRLKKAYDYMWRAFNENIPTPAGVSGRDVTDLSSPVYPGIEVAYKEFGANSMRLARNLRQPIGNVSKLFLGFTTFTHYNIDGQSGAYFPANIPVGKKVTFYGNNNRFVSSNYGENQILVADRGSACNWEYFMVEPADLWNRGVALKSVDKYVSSDNGGIPLTVNKETIGIYEQFYWIIQEDGKVSLMNIDNKYVSNENGSTAGMSGIKSTSGPSETFTVTVTN